MKHTSQRSDCQRDVVTFLSDPSSYGSDVDRVDVIDTHISKVFLAGDYAYKLKRAVKLPYLDFSNEALRRAACAAEVSLNRRTAPELYLEARALSVTESGGIAWGDKGRIVDWVVVMRRFAQDCLLDSMAAKGMLGADLLRDVIDHIAWFHARAEVLSHRGGSEAVGWIEKTNVECLKQSAGNIFRREDIDDLHRRSLQRLARVAELLDARRAAGKVRRCHGDLHLRNICLFNGNPVLFDCIEFSDELAVIDVLYDIAFLLMDLAHRGLQDLANQAFNRYLDLTTEDDGLAALPLFMSLRAAVRAHVTATAAKAVGPGDFDKRICEGRSYLDFARRVLEPQPVRLIAIGGMSGTGKSTLAQALAPAMGMLPGARVLRSDVIRKRCRGVMPEHRLPADAYTSQVSERVYTALRDRARVALEAGYSVIIDAVSLREDERTAFAGVAANANVPFCGIWLDAAAATMGSRLAARRNDASDAGPEVLRQQLEVGPGRVHWTRVDVGDDFDSSLAAVREALASARHGTNPRKPA
jgi:uncharacterized protein